MAKVSAVKRDQKRRDLIKKFSAKRIKLKTLISKKDAPVEERFAATLALAELPRNSAPNRARNRCALTGRPRSVHRKFKLCRNALRKLASEGQLPGVVKSSW